MAADQPLFPFLKPNPPKLSELSEELEQIEGSGWFTNYGPVNSRFESSAISELFGDQGHCVTMNNATSGLILAIQQVIHAQPKLRARKYALMPSFTFAATGHAALWNRLTPLFCDIDPHTWLPSRESEG